MIDENQLKKLLQTLKHDLGSEIYSKIESVQKEFNAKWELLVKQQRTLQDSVDRLDRDVGNDRKHIDDTLMKVNDVASQMDEIRSLHTQQTQKLKETVQDAVAQGVEDVGVDIADIKKSLETP